ncbi:MAG: 23S rRNA (adenine(2503)-C(2))-methyltransferase RlmN [Candidatus Omnitrophota bacterium]|nr:23S rRNA (adenine(2503)-C(2))-methyltransferase RlmN [Candidatus Omnitrophota bacterium]
MNNRKDVKNFTLEEFEKELENISEPDYRARQIFSWIYKRLAGDFSAMDNIPKPLREKLAQSYYIGAITPLKHLKSRDRTEKVLFRLEDGNLIESVLIYAGRRVTLCISTQAGCKFACLFCASGMNGFKRNLAVSEILSQIISLERNLKYKITNYVFMGMGEPLDNYENVSKAIKIMNSKYGMGIAARRITVSTSGLVPGIEKFKGLGLQVNLSISLHAINNELRDKLMPINKKYPLDKVLKACEDYVDNGGRMLTFEYVLIKGTNDAEKDIDGLVKIAKRLKAKINLIPYSPIPGVNFQAPMEKDVKTFEDRLLKRGINVTVRESKGRDIMAACGQLAGTQTT